MNVYKTENIRNVALLGHGGSGKTTLVEAMAYTTKITTRMGTITDGNTISDFDKEEIKRKFSISTTVIPIEFNGLKINILDTLDCISSTISNCVFSICISHILFIKFVIVFNRRSEVIYFFPYFLIACAIFLIII